MSAASHNSGNIRLCFTPNSAAKTTDDFFYIKNQHLYSLKSKHAHIMGSDKVSDFVRDICHMDRFGGRCTRNDIGAWEITDITQWTEEQHTALRKRFPRIAAKVVANRKSLSGFSVILRSHKVSHAWISLLVCAVMVTSITALSRVWISQR